MNRIKIIKTLPHLHPLFLQREEPCIYSESYSFEVVKFLEGCKLIPQKGIKFSDLKKHLEVNQYRKTNKPDDMYEYAIKGDVVSFWPAGVEHPLRLEFFGEKCENLYSYDEIYGRKIENINGIIISDYKLSEKIDAENIKLQTASDIDLGSEFSKIIFVNSLHKIPNIDKYKIVETDFGYAPLFWSKINLLESEVLRLKNIGYKILIKTNHEEQLPVYMQEFLFLENKKLELSVDMLHSINLPAGFISNSLKLAVFTDREIFGTIYLTQSLNRKDGDSFKTSKIRKLLRQLEGSIEMGDYVVHEDYGVAVYAGLKQEEVDGVINDYLLLKYDHEDELYVPLNQIEKITKYIGNEGIEPKLTRLGRVTWENLKKKVRTSAKLVARDLIEHFAKRELAKATPIKNFDSKDYVSLVEDFPYSETDDQMRAINEVIADLELARPMNRLVVGDVGFGKTEVIMRAAFKVVENGGQVAVLAPTTVLTSQHYKVFSERFKKYPIETALVSRFNSPGENKNIIKRINAGVVDIAIGTHRLLSSDVLFKKLQLLVIDEEQRFGVRQKEKIKRLNYGTHVLYVTATPIPRTLGMTLSAIQDISIMSTPPVNRKPIKTEVIKNDLEKISSIISAEIQRGGQIFFLHNEVISINSVKKKLSEFLPGVKFIVAHGQMNSKELDRIMTLFYEKKYDVLVTTTIIENGLDLPNVNTVIINNAHKFGLSQLYQLRGRVGRAETQAYCYLVYSQANSKESANNESSKLVKKNTKPNQRLQTLVDNQTLGSGFSIASKDLEIRGSGSFLGEKQHGHISNIGYALYVELLSEEVERLKSILKLD